MLPALPGDLLVPLAMATGVSFFLMILFIVGRRAWIFHRGRIEDVYAARFESLLLGFSTGEVDGLAVRKEFRRLDRHRIKGLLRAVRKLEKEGDREVRERVLASEILPILEKALLHARDVWTRAAAARALGELESAPSLKALAFALDDPEPNVAYTAGAALAMLNVPEAAHAVFRRIRVDSTLNPSRLAAMLEVMKCDLSDVFRAVLNEEDRVALFWALDLIGRRKIYDLVEEVRRFLSHPDANVRASAAEAIGELAVPLSDRWLEPLLEDEAWFVRSHAAKSLGELQAEWAAPQLVEMLSHSEWWVRQNAADALVRLGARMGDLVEEILFSNDRFARNTAVEVLERIGWVEAILLRAAREDPQAVHLLKAFAANGGIGYLENALGTAPGEAIGILLDLLAELGDDATVGRIRACLEYNRIPEVLVPRAREIAVALRRA